MDELGATLESTVDLVVRVIDDADARGDGSGLRALRRRARTILDASVGTRTTKSSDQVEIDLEHGCWVWTTSHLLLPAQRDAVAEALRADRRENDEGSLDDPWGVLDPIERSARQKAVETRILRACRTAVAACRRYEQTRRTSYLRDAVLELETTVRVERERLASSGLSAASCGEQGDRLDRALRRALPASAFHLFVSLVRDIIADGMDNRPRVSRAQGAEREQWLSRESRSDRNGEEPRTGPWFVEAVQQLYDEQLEREREAEEAEDRRQQEEAERHLQWETG